MAGALATIREEMHLRFFQNAASMLGTLSHELDLMEDGVIPLTVNHRRELTAQMHMAYNWMVTAIRTDIVTVTRFLNPSEGKVNGNELRVASCILFRCYFLLDKYIEVNERYREVVRSIQGASTY